MNVEYFSWKKIGGLALLAACFVILIIFTLQIAARPIAKILPPVILKQAGDYIAVPYMHKYGICHAPAGVAALNKITQRITVGSHIQQKFKIAVIDDPQANNAFAVPGWQILLFAGLIQATDTPEELAGVLAHEISHLLHGDPEVALIRDNGLFIAFLAMFGRDPSISHQLLTMKFSRATEFTADATAIELLTNAQINTKGLTSFLSKLQGGSNRSKFNLNYLLATHPAAATRIKLIEQQTTKYPSRQILSQAEWMALKNICGRAPTP